MNKPGQSESETVTAEKSCDDRIYVVTYIYIHFMEQMVKCILLKDKKGRFVLACLTGEATLNTQAVRKYEDGLARLSFASPEEISTMLGYQLGSVAPLNLRQSIPVVLDNQIKSQTKLNISSGDPRLGLELETETLLNLLDQPIFGDIRKIG